MSNTDRDQALQELGDAAAKGDLDLVRNILITTNVDINGDTTGNSSPWRGTALHVASRAGRVPVILFLLEQNADIHLRMGQWMGTPLVEAVYGGRIPAVKTLLEHGANPNDRYYRGSVLQEACSARRKEIVQLLLEYGADVNVPGTEIGFEKLTGPVHAAAMWADEDILQSLLEKATYATLHAKNERGEGPLCAAVEMVDVPKIRVLLQYGVKVDLSSLQLACSRRHEGTLQTLLEACLRGALEPGCSYDQAVSILSAALQSITPLIAECDVRGFTVHKVQLVWKNGLSSHKLPGYRSDLPQAWGFQPQDGRRQMLRSICQRLFRGAQNNPEGQFENLDHLTLDLAEREFWRFRRTVVKFGLDDGAIVNGACKRLCQLPPSPPALRYRKLEVPFGMSNSLPREFFLDTARGEEVPIWDDLKVSAMVSTLVIKAALYISCGATSRIGLFGLGHLLQFLGEILNTIFEMASTPENTSGTDEDVWFIVKTFLWVTWQRIRLLDIGHMFHDQVKDGLEDHEVHKWAVAVPGWRDFAFSSKVVESVNGECPKPPYMCNWAYKLILTTGSPVLTDLRRLVHRYTELWGRRPPRCNHSSPCSGGSPHECSRFVGATIVDQSAHDLSCGPAQPCTRICWDEAAYRLVGAGASVLIDASVGQNQPAAYCKASERTLAISHVWVHGQGGRPDTGINSCLHRRYCATARRLDCDSYWIDTMCIPQDHELRKDAIMSINAIFQGSKACLVCDRDVMEIDISALKSGRLSQSAQLQLRETILATIMFCDWNVRAWTFLEAMQGRDKILFLCRHNDTISLQETLDIIMSDGCVDIGIAFLSTPHLLPFKAPKEPEEHSWVDDFDKALPENNERLEEAAACLRYRPASRQGDAFIIWTILAGSPTLDSPQTFWESRRGTLLTTGFLMSGAPRVQAKGFHWAPSEPTSQKVPSLFCADPKDHSDEYPGVEVMATEEGNITDAGFCAFWDVLHLDMPFEEPGSIGSRDIAGIKELSDAARKQFPYGKSRIALLRPILRAFGRFRDDASAAKRSVLSFVAVCEFWEEDGGWKWLGVRKLDSSRHLRLFALEKILLV